MKDYLTSRIILNRFVSATAAALMAVAPSLPAYAQSYQDRIDGLKNEVSDLSGAVETLQTRGATLRETIGKFEAQIAKLESQIAGNQDERVALTGQISTAEADIDRRMNTLADNLRMMYLEGEVSSLEKVASSRSISEFVDKQEYRNKIQERVATAMKEIEALKQRLEKQRVEVEQLIKDDSAMKQQVDSQKSAKAQLLAETRGSEARFQKRIDSKEALISDLQEKQAAAIAAQAAQSGSYFVSQGGGGSYPWAGAGFPCAGGDPWGMCFRQCVSYAAWKVASTGRHMPYWGGVGNANQWPGNAQAAGIPTGYEPRAGAVAVMMSGPYGHVMYVEEVLGGGQIRVSEYNYAWDGTYSERIQSGAGLIYIYF